jgi:4-carboxymuconolactone decarboxylase
MTAAQEPSPNMPLNNAVLDDPTLQEALKGVHPAFGDFCTRVAGEAWGKPLLDQRTKALITIAIDVVNQGLSPESPYEAHIRMALKQGVTFAEIEELVLFLCVYAGFNKAAPAFVRLSQIRASIEA